MEPPRIEIIKPTSRAWQGMATVLFRPFDIGKWFLLGFSAWLAGLLDGSASFNFNFGSDFGGSGPGGSPSGPGGPGGLHHLERWVHEHVGPIILVASLVLVVLLAIYIALMWVSSRGKFMFLDNAVHNRFLIKEPWGRFKSPGNSLCLWRLAFTLAVILLLLPLAGATLYFAGVLGGGEMTIPGVVAGILAILAVVLAAAYIGILLEDFVIPTMYRHGVTTTAAWRKFLAVHHAALGSFILYVLWRILLGLAVAAATTAFALVTCCIGGILLAIPYLGAVLLLPVSVFFRLLGPEFLRQFGPAYDAFGADGPSPPVTG